MDSIIAIKSSFVSLSNNIVATMYQDCNYSLNSGITPGFARRLDTSRGINADLR